MRALEALRGVVWAAAAAGIFIAFAWPWVISDDPASPLLRAVGMTVFGVFLVSLALAACVTAVLRRDAGGS
jgi:hypothetical protein